MKSIVWNLGRYEERQPLSDTIHAFDFKNYNQQTTGMIALNRQGTQQRRPEWPIETPPGKQVNTRYTQTPPNIHPQKRMPPVTYIVPSISGTRQHRCVQAYDRISSYSDMDIVL